METYKERLLELAKSDIYHSDSGYYVYGPSFKGGYLTAHDLRIIADHLDEINKPWDHMVHNGICGRCGKAKEMSRTLDQDGMVMFYDCDCEITGEVNGPTTEISWW